MNAKELSLKWLPLAWMGSLFTSLTFIVLRGLNIDIRGLASALGVSNIFVLALLIYEIWSLAAVTILFSLLRGKGMNRATVGLKGSLSLKAAGYAVMGAAVAIFLWLPVEAIVKALGGRMFWYGDSEPWTINTPVDGLLLFLLPVVIAPVLEEILYRGYVLTMLCERTRSTLMALILCCLIFSSNHYAFGPGLMAYIFIGTFIPSLLYLRFKNLYPGMLMHSLNNLCAYVVLPLLLVRT